MNQSLRRELDLPIQQNLSNNRVEKSNSISNEEVYLGEASPSPSPRDLTEDPHEIFWCKTFNPRVKREINVCFTFVILLSFASYVSVLFVAALNLQFDIFFAIHEAWLDMGSTRFFFFSVAALWLWAKFMDTFCILFTDMRQLMSLAWGSRYDERLHEFLWKKVKDSRLKETAFEGWMRRSLTAYSKRNLYCFKIAPGNVWRLLYCFFVVLLIPILAFGENYDRKSIGPTLFAHSYCMSSLLVALVFLSAGWIYEYYILLWLMSKKLKLKKDHTINIRWTSYSFILSKWVFWLFWDNAYLSLGSTGWNTNSWKLFWVFNKLIFCPCFITWMFLMRDSSVGAIFTCTMVPWVQYFLCVFKQVRKNLVECKNWDRRSEERSSLLDYIRHKGLCISYFIFVVLLILSLGTIGSLIFTSEDVKISLTESNRYPICKTNFAFGSDTLGPAEMALLVWLSWGEQAIANQSINWFLGAENFVWVNIDDSFKQSGVHFYHIKATVGTPALHGLHGNVVKHYVVIRGTSSLQDALETISLWSEIASFQIINFFIPLLNFWSRTVTSDLVYWLSKLVGWLGNSLHSKNYISDVFNYVSDIYSPWDIYVKDIHSVGDQVMTIGFSLGGGLANIVASKEYAQYMEWKVPPRTTSYGISPVGTIYSSRKFGFDWHAVTATETSIWTEFDIVPLIDRHMGLHQVIPCLQTSFTRCHSIVNTLCQLWGKCSLPISALRWGEKENFLNCLCCNEGSATTRTTLCVSDMIEGVTWNRSCIATS